MSIQPQHAEIGLFVTCDNPKCQNITHMGYYDREEPVDATNAAELAARANHARVETLSYFIDRGWNNYGNHWYCPTCGNYPRQLMESNREAFRREIENPIRPGRTIGQSGNTAMRIEPNLAGPRIITKPTHITTPGGTQ